MVSQNAIPSKKHLGGYNPYVFTEQGVAMLSSVLNSERSIQVNITIMRTFVRLKQIISLNSEKRRPYLLRSCAFRSYPRLSNTVLTRHHFWLRLRCPYRCRVTFTLALTDCFLRRRQALPHIRNIACSYFLFRHFQRNNVFKHCFIHIHCTTEFIF